MVLHRDRRHAKPCGCVQRQPCAEEVGVQVVRDGRVETRAVKTGLIWQGRREILSGLEPGEQVIARAGAFFRDGDRVRVAP